ncbi:DUF559 domain-containing protein [Svornostia abyssi]|uniref:DUF559 domain-containing protein n=1 Tax=Svornostia abyssi TaxID=2898438 RepID=A0ABY5PN73_9ACTN|nr:DUF559 domain-containing protein [Parviterribacteraceae bacterium J379]
MHSSRGCRVDHAIAQLAGRQHELVELAQLRALGLTPRQIDYRLEIGRLHRRYRTVYVVGSPGLSLEGERLAAMLAAGPGAVLSHAAACHHWRLLRRQPTGLDVTVPTSGGRAQQGFRVHRHPTLRPPDTTTRLGIPVVRPARAILDLAQTARRDITIQAIDEAHVQRLARGPHLHTQVAAYPKHPGAKALREILRTHVGGSLLTDTDLEDLFLEICRTHGLPQPATQHRIGRLTVDFAFPASRIAIETDGGKYHGTPAAVRRDHRRDSYLIRMGWQVLRFSDEQIEYQPQIVAATILAAFRPPAPAR